MERPPEKTRHPKLLDEAEFDPCRREVTPDESSSSSESGETQHAWDGGHPIDLRFSVPLPYFPFYLTIVAGRERRSKKRLKQDRRKHPLVTLGNMIFMGYSGAVIAIALGAIAMTATVLVIQRLFEIEIILS